MEPDSVSAHVMHARLSSCNQVHTCRASTQFSTCSFNLCSWMQQHLPAGSCKRIGQLLEFKLNLKQQLLALVAMVMQ